MGEVSGVKVLVRVLGFGFRVTGFGSRVSGFGFRVSGFGFRVSDAWCLVSGFGRAGVLGVVSNLVEQVEVDGQVSTPCLILCEKSFNLKLSGNEVYYTASSSLGTLNHSCSKLHCQKVLI